MYRKVFKIETEADLNIKLPDEYLHKELEVIAYEIENENEKRAQKEKNFKDLEMFIKNFHIDMSKFKFNRDEANER